MSIYPQPLKYRNELTLRHGIKSSLPNLKGLISLCFVLYIVNDKKSSVEYCVEDSADTLQIDPLLLVKVKDFFNDYTTKEENYEKLLVGITNNALLSSQMEHLQVALQLFLKLCRITFTNQDYPSNKERTGGKRYSKTLHYSTNINLFDTIISSKGGVIEDDGREILWNWIIGADSERETFLLFNIKSFLTSATEETQFKVRPETVDGDTEIYFQQEGIYKSLLENKVVISIDRKEPVGPFRVLKSFIKLGLHIYLEEVGGHFQSKVPNEELRNYLEKVSTSLDLIPKRIVQIIEPESAVPAPRGHLTTDTHNKIYFGSPGTGKSTAIQSFVKTKNLTHYRTTFHPDYDYGSFVGSYKPVSEGDAIRYRFVPQVFTHAYRHAWERPDETVVLIIEEINRGNCAQIFGDLFQSLDRDEAGYSCYDVDADADLAAYFTQSAEYTTALQYLSTYQEAKGMTVSASKIILPPNLLLYATMNTSDQSLFPMDAAFKRRWDWEYVPIDYDQARQDRVKLPGGRAFNWGDFIAGINPKITNLTRSDDKQIGNWFVRPAAGTDLIPYRQFRSKVMYYLWAEVCKEEQENSESLYFWRDATGESQPFTYNDLYGAGETDIVTGFLRYHEIAMA